MSRSNTAPRRWPNVPRRVTSAVRRPRRSAPTRRPSSAAGQVTAVEHRQARPVTNPKIKTRRSPPGKIKNGGDQRADLGTGVGACSSKVAKKAVRRPQARQRRGRRRRRSSRTDVGHRRRSSGQEAVDQRQDPATKRSTPRKLAGSTAQLVQATSATCTATSAHRQRRSRSTARPPTARSRQGSDRWRRRINGEPRTSTNRPAIERRRGRLDDRLAARSAARSRPTPSVDWSVSAFAACAEL